MDTHLLYLKHKKYFTIQRMIQVISLLNSARTQPVTQAYSPGKSQNLDSQSHKGGCSQGRKESALLLNCSVVPILVILEGMGDRASPVEEQP